MATYKIYADSNGNIKSADVVAVNDCLNDGDTIIVPHPSAVGYIERLANRSGYSVTVCVAIDDEMTDE